MTPDHRRMRLLPPLVLLVLALAVAWPGSAQDVLTPLLGGEQAPSAAEQPRATIEAETDPAQDRAIAQRLSTIFAAIEGLGPITVEVRSGVVVLGGEVGGQAQKAQALRLARSVRGVVEVDDRIVVAQALERRVRPALQRLAESWQAFLRLLPVLAVGLVVMAASFVLARLLARPARLWRRVSPNPFVARMVSQLAQLCVVLTGAFLTLLLLDATPILRTLLGAAGIIGLALGFALRDTVENYIASVLLSLRRPFGPEDYVRIEGHEGIVLRLTTRATILLTLDGNEVRIPNATVFKGVITNFTKAPRRRFTFQLGVAPGEDLAAAQRAAIESLQGVSGVMADPAPAAYYERIGDSAVELTVVGWMDQRSHDFIRVRSEAIRIVLTRMNELGIDLPEPTLRLRRATPPGALPPPAPVTEPVVETTRDRALDEVLEAERRRPSGLGDAAPAE